MAAMVWKNVVTRVLHDKVYEQKNDSKNKQVIKIGEKGSVETCEKHCDFG